MRWNKSIYTDPQIDNVGRVISRLKSPSNRKKRRLVNSDITEHLYCVCISSKSPFVMEILKFTELIKTVYESCEYTIIGLAASKNAAINLATYVILESLSVEGDHKKIKDSIYNGNLF